MSGSVYINLRDLRYGLASWAHFRIFRFQRWSKSHGGNTLDNALARQPRRRRFVCRTLTANGFPRTTSRIRSRCSLLRFVRDRVPVDYVSGKSARLTRYSLSWKSVLEFLVSKMGSFFPRSISIRTPSGVYCRSVKTPGIHRKLRKRGGKPRHKPATIRKGSYAQINFSDSFCLRLCDSFQGAIGSGKSSVHLASQCVHGEPQRHPEIRRESARRPL